MVVCFLKKNHILFFKWPSLRHIVPRNMLCVNVPWLCVCLSSFNNRSRLGHAGVATLTDPPIFSFVNTTEIERRIPIENIYWQHYFNYLCLLFYRLIKAK